MAGIEERMEVYASCGKKVGVVDHLEGTRSSSRRVAAPDGPHRLIPTAWVRTRPRKPRSPDQELGRNGKRMEVRRRFVR